MKILYLNGYLGAGGAEKLIFDIVPRINKKIKCDIAILSEKNTFYLNDLRESKIKIHVLSKEGLYSFCNVIRLIKIIKKEKYKIVHVHTFPSLYIAGIASYFCPETKFIYTEHSTYNNRRKYRCLKLFEELIYSRFSKIICIGEKTEINLRNHIKDFSKRILMIENGVDLKKFREARALERKEINKELTSNDILLAMVGRFSLQKDQITLIKAMKELPQNYKLLLIGDGKLRRECEHKVDRLNLNNRVFFLGVRKDIPSILKAIDISILSSFWEGFGLVAIESMAAGVPVIGTNVDGLKEVIGNKSYMFEVGDYKGLAKKILKLTKSKQDKTLKDYLLTTSEKYSIDKMLERYIELYNSVIK